MSYSPLPAIDKGPDQKWRDKSRGGFDLQQLERMIRDCNEQPDVWRMRSDLAHAYYDGKQLNEQQRAFAESEGLTPRSTNLIARVINAVLGQEARNRSDVRIESDSDELGDVTDVLNVQLKEAQRESKADMAVSAAYGCQVKGGVGWVEVSRDPDPLNYPYRIREIHRSEMWWDWRAQDFLLRDARWVVRSQWHDLDDLIAAMPEHEDILRMLVNTWEGWAETTLVNDFDSMDSMTRAFDDFRRFKIRSSEWLDSMRQRVRLYEVWYKVPATAVVMRLGPTRVILFDEKNPLHQVAVQRKLVRLEKVLTRQVRCAIFAGPYRLKDTGTTSRNFPYVPFFAFRDDEDRSPYGLIEGMISPQDEYNERRLRVQWLLKARQVFVDNDALDTKYNNIEDLADEAQRPDMVLVRNAARRNANGVEIMSNLTLQKEQVDVMNDAKMLIQDIPGVYPVQLGNAPSGVTSGVAISGLVEQGIVAMGELNDNYRNARQLVFENLLDLIVEDYSQADLKVLVGEGSSRRPVVLNTFDKTGMPMNMVKDAPVRVGLSEVPSSPAARMQQQTMIAEIIKSLGNFPQAVAVLVPPFLEASAMDSETRKQAVDDFRKVMGLPGGSRQERLQAEQQAAQAAAQQQALQQEAAVAEVDKVKADVAQKLSAAELNIAKAEQIRNQEAIEEALAEADGPSPPAKPKK